MCLEAGRPRPCLLGRRLFQSHINIHLSVLRILGSLIVDFKVCLIGTFEFFAVLQFPELPPNFGHNFWQRAFLAGQHAVLACRNRFSDHSCGRPSSILHHRSNDVGVFAIVVAGVVRVDRIDVRSRPVRNFLQDSILEKPLPLPRNCAISRSFFGVSCTRFNPDYEKCRYVCAGNGCLLRIRSPVVGRSSLVVGPSLNRFYRVASGVARERMNRFVRNSLSLRMCTSEYGP